MPAVEWVTFSTTKVYEGAFTQKVRDQFTPLVAKAAQQFLNERVNNRLTTALGAGSAPAPTQPGDAPAAAVQSEAAVEKDLRGSSDGVVTTIEALEDIVQDGDALRAAAERLTGTVPAQELGCRTPRPSRGVRPTSAGGRTTSASARAPEPVTAGPLTAPDSDSTATD